MSLSQHLEPRREPPAQPFHNPMITVVVIVIVLAAGLVLGGVSPSAAVGTLSASGLAAVEILRRLAAVSADGRRG